MPPFTPFEDIPCHPHTEHTDVVREKGNAVLIGMAAEQAYIRDILKFGSLYTALGLIYAFPCGFYFRVPFKGLLHVCCTGICSRVRRGGIDRVDIRIEGQAQKVIQFRVEIGDLNLCGKQGVFVLEERRVAADRGDLELISRSHTVFRFTEGLFTGGNGGRSGVLHFPGDDQAIEEPMGVKDNIRLRLTQFGRCNLLLCMGDFVRLVYLG